MLLPQKNENTTPLILKVVGVFMCLSSFSSLDKIEKSIVNSPNWYFQYGLVVTICFIIIGVLIYKGKKIGFNSYFFAKIIDILCLFEFVGIKAIDFLIPQLLGSTIVIGILIYHRKSFK